MMIRIEDKDMSKLHATPVMLRPRMSAWIGGETSAAQSDGGREVPDQRNSFLIFVPSERVVAETDDLDQRGSTVYMGSIHLWTKRAIVLPVTLSAWNGRQNDRAYPRMLNSG
jgi:hypothetical protein